eukprot:GHVT01020770.1.p2 GENE.GHVT01020770.1~~GHVT01020770.1.p2  ORF type:complete len:110 (+),score=21.55 GHVT01020770.1:717-1046(+)
MQLRAESVEQERKQEVALNAVRCGTRVTSADGPAGDQPIGAIPIKEKQGARTSSSETSCVSPSAGSASRVFSASDSPPSSCKGGVTKERKGDFDRAASPGVKKQLHYTP